ncbi:MAG TPA: calcium-binding protein [Nocardioides sp.]|uniref:calcium-binding protein n=1 Tax=Nocardioides sp. TaxID=35761 RepID=UPI002E354494|nr:calcium-binding protein [Nocardioides sp.]HEX5088102.1 calcium-binding protein [Nocardioides sp.]
MLAGAAVTSLTAALAFASSASATTTAQFTRGHRVLTIYGDAGSNAITVGRDAAGVIDVNGGAVVVHGSRATVHNVDRIVVFAGAGNDRVFLDETNGPLPNASLRGGAGDDALFGDSGADRLYGGRGNDALIGGPGSDRSLGGAGDDQLIWNPGDGSDLNEGGDGSDAVVVNGGGVGEAFTATANATRVRFDRVSPLPFSLDIGTSERLVVNGNGGDDSFTASGDLASLIALDIDGGTGNDLINGGNGNDTLTGGLGDDTVDGNGGADTAALGDGDDTFVWDAGDGSDIVEGETGQDALVFNGAAAAEQLTLSANGTRARLARDLGHVTMDLDGIELVDTNAFGGADTVTIDDLSGTDVTETDVALTGAPGGKAGDATADSVVVNATDGADTATITGDEDDAVSVSGLHALVQVFASDGPSDTLTFNALGGDDTVDATGLAAGSIGLTVNGGDGADVLSGGPGTVLNQ